MGTLRGCDVVMRALAQQGVRRVFTLSGNHIMSLFDAALDVGIELVHVRHARSYPSTAWCSETGPRQPDSARTTPDITSMRIGADLHQHPLTCPAAAGSRWGESFWM
jgi:Thiamine pyrophosphate enzyme, N-terminal TPP binding domain